MNYLGGKSGLGASIAGVIRKYLPGRELVEPFVGGFNIAPYMNCPVLCGDAHEGLIRLYTAWQDGWRPTFIDEPRYRELQARRDWDDPHTAIAAFGMSFGGKEFAGYARARSKPDGTYYRQTVANLERKTAAIRRATFVCADYRALPIPAGSVIYCDPPYSGTQGYSPDFDADAFRQWCRHMTAAGCVVLVSEFEGADGWVPVWEKKRANNLKPEETVFDRLFMVDGTMDPMVRFGQLTILDDAN